jgi:polyisoprenoid-binding protein YceI
MKYLLFLFVLAIAISSAVHATTLEIVREHSRVSFDIDYMMMTKVEGQFKGYHGFFDINDKENQLSNIRVEVTADTVDTNDTKRDFHLRGHEFLYAAVYPDISFKAQGTVRISDAKKFQVNGEVNLRGITKPLVLTGIYKGKGVDSWGKISYFLEMTGEINRKDFGIIWNKQVDTGGYLLGDMVRLTIIVQAQKLGDKTPFSTHMIPSTKGIVERHDLKTGKIKKLTTPTDPNDQSAPKK